MPDKADKLGKRAYWIAVAQYLSDDVLARMALDLALDGQIESAAKIKLCYKLISEVFQELSDKWGREIAEETGKKLVDVLLDAMKAAKEKLKVNKN